MLRVFGVVGVVLACVLAAGLAAQTPAQRVYQPGDGVTNPVLLKSVEPRYTEDALRRQVQGTVVLQIVVMPDGAVGEITPVKEIDGEPDLTEQAVTAAKLWEFKPGTLNGSAVPVRVRLELEFRVHPRPEAAPAPHVVTRVSQDAAQASPSPDDFLAGVHLVDEPRLVKPKAIHMVEPKYTPSAMRQRIQGVVEIEAVVMPDGTVGRARVATSLDPTNGLDQAALDAARLWRFEPGTLDGVAVPTLVHLSLQFSLH